MSKWRPSELNCIYVIGDINGNFHKLKLILNRILPLRKSDGGKDSLIMLGNFSGGSNTSKVIDLVMPLKLKYKDRVRLLLGLNDHLMREGIKLTGDSSNYIEWMKKSGEKDIISYMLAANINKNDPVIKNPYLFPRQRIPTIIPDSHKEFLNSLELCYEIDNFMFANAGLDPVLSVENQSFNDVIYGNNLYKTAKLYHKNNKMMPWSKNIVIGGHGDGPFITPGLSMIGSTDEIVVLEARSLKAFSARFNNKRLVYID